MLKKMMLLAMAVGVLVAFAAPAMASASTWDTNGEPLGESTAEGDAVHFTGTLTSTKEGVKISCNATANTVLWNDPVAGAVGEATLTLSADPETNPGCTVAVLVAPGTYADVPGCEATPSTKGENWAISTSGSAVAIEGSNFTNEFHGCEETLGIPDGTKVGASGTATGTVVGECIVFNESGDLSEGTLIDGELCPAPGSGLQLTA